MQSDCFVIVDQDEKLNIMLPYACAKWTKWRGCVLIIMPSDTLLVEEYVICDMHACVCMCA